MRSDHVRSIPERGDPLVVDCSRDRGELVIRVSGELDLATVDVLRDALQRAEAADARRIVLDLSGLDFIDARGVHVVLEAEARSRSDGLRLALVRGPDHVQRVFVLAGVADTLPFA
jgi:anti-sigma B factor antagonist